MNKLYVIILQKIAIISLRERERETYLCKLMAICSKNKWFPRLLCGVKALLIRPRDVIEDF